MANRPARRRRREEEIQEAVPDIIDLRMDGLSIKEIAKRLKLNPNTVGRVLRENNVQVDKVPLRDGVRHTDPYCCDGCGLTVRYTPCQVCAAIEAKKKGPVFSC